MNVLRKTINQAVASCSSPVQKHNIRMLAGTGLAVGLALAPTFAFAALGSGPSLAGNGVSLGDISENVVNSLSGASQVVTALAYLGAISFGFIGALKWKAHGEQPDRTPMKVPVTYWGIAAICAALPEFIGTGIATLWGTNASLVEPI